MADLNELFSALERADAAGNLKDARAIASMIRQLQKDAEPKPSVGGYVRETLKAVPRGLVSGLESAALGAASLLPGDTEEGFEKTAREKIKGLAERLKPEAAAGYEDAIPIKLGEAIGSMGSLLIPGGVGGLAARGAGLAARTGQRIAVAPTAAALGAGEARERAVEAKATPEQITKVTALGVIPGIAELASIERIFGVMPKEIKGGVFDYVKRALVTGGFEGAQEAASKVAQNLIAQQVYKPSQELIEGVGEDAAYGAGAGAIVQFLVDAVAGRRAPSAKPTAKPSEEAPAAEAPQVIEQPVPPAPRTEAETALSNLLAARGQYEALPIDDKRRIKWAGNIAKYQSILDKLDAEKAKESAFATEMPDLFGEYRPAREAERPELTLTSEQQLEQQLELPLEEPVVREPETSKVTADTLIGLGFSPITVKTSKFSKKLQALDLSNPNDIDLFEETVRIYRNQYPKAKMPSKAVISRFIEQARFRTAKQTELFPEAPDVARSETTGEGVGVPVSQRAAGRPGPAGAGAAGVAGSEGPLGAAPAGEKQQSTTLSDVEEVQTAFDIAKATKDEKERLDAVTYLSYFANSPDVGPSAKLEARKALDALGVPEAEAQAAWENLAISEAAAAQERLETEAEARSNRDQRNITDQQRRAAAAEKRAEKTTKKKPVTAKEKAQYANATKRMELKAPDDVPFETAEDANALLESYAKEVEASTAKVPVREFIDKADLEDIARLMAEKQFDAAHTAVVQTLRRAYTAALADRGARTYSGISKAGEYWEKGKVYRLSHRPVGAGLSQRAVAALEKGDLKGALRDVMANGSTPQIRLAARKILSAIRNTKVQIGKSPTGDPAIYDADTDTIYIDPQALHEHTLLHESMHAAVAHVLADPNHPLTKKLQALFDSLRPEIKGQYGATNLQEFAAESISNQEFQDLLRDSPKNWWGRFVDAIRGFLGLTKAKQVMRTLDALLEYAPSAPGQATGIMPVKTTGNAILDSALERRKQAVEKVTAKNKTSNWVGKLRNLIVEKGTVLGEKLIKKGGAAARAAKVYKLSLRSMDLAINSMLDGPIQLDKDTNNQWFKPNRDMPSFRNIHAEIDKIAEKAGGKKNAEDLFSLGATLLRMRSPEISPEIRKSMNMSAADTQAAEEALRLYGTEIKAALAYWQQYKNALLNVGMQTGRFTAEDVAEWKKAAEYVPWHRILDDAKNGYDTKKSTKSYFNRLVDNGKVAELIGGDINERPIGDILNNMENLSIWLVNTTVRNHTANQLVDALVKYVGDARPLTNPQQGDSSRTIKTYRDGKPAYWELGDPLDKDAFDSTSTVSLPALKAMTTVANWMRKGTTLMPGFVVSQLAQDAFRVTVLSGANRPFMTGAKTLANFAKALGPAREQNLAYTALYEAGIAARADYMVGDERTRLQAALDRSQTGVRGAVKQAMGFLDNMTRASDAAQRMALFEETMLESGDKLDALYKASEIINFQSQGKSATINTLRQVVPFLNAYIQGMDITFRTMTGRGISGKSRAEAMRRFYATGAKIAALSWVYAALVSDDDEYQQTADHEKLNSFIIPGSRKLVKEVTGVDIGGNLRIPTPQDPVGFVFKSIPEQVHNYIARAGTANEIDNTKFLRIMRDGVVNAISSPNVVPQAVKPSLELLTNYSFFTGRPIVGKGLEGLLKNEQFTSTTSEFAKIFSPFTPLSPVQLDYFIRGTFGTAGGVMAYYTSQLINTASPVPLPETRLNENPMVRAFISGKSTADAKEDYYELRERVTTLARTVDRLAPIDPAKAREYLQEKPKVYALAKSGIFAEVDKKLGEFRVVRRAIEASSTLSAEDKRAKLDQLDAMELRLFNNLRLATLRQIGGL